MKFGIFFVYVCYFCCSMSRSQPNQNYLLKETRKSRPLLQKLQKTDSTKQHEIIIALKQNNLDILEEILLDISSPKSINYQKWLSFEEVGKFIENSVAFDKVLQWINNIENSKITWISPRKEYIKVVNTIRTWETELLCNFYDFIDLSQNNDKFYTIADEYSIPIELDSYISWIFKTIENPPVFHKKYEYKGNNTVYKTNLRYDSVDADAVTVSFLNDYYSITSNLGDENLSQSVFETSQESYSPDDLLVFEDTFSLPIETVIDYNGYNTTDCASTDCYEGNLDIQYITGVSQYTTSIYWYVGGDNPFVTWLIDMSAESNPPQVNSMSWGSIEEENSQSTLEQFNTEAMKLGLIGVTITVSSGDDGAPNIGDAEQCLCNYDSSSDQLNWTVSESWVGRGYFPSFPATSPYVTAVGATMGPNKGSAEIACMSNYGGVITSGGGFSQYYPTPSWQTQAVNTYLDAYSKYLSPGYNKNGRGYPDVSLIGVNYAVIVDGAVTYLYGTSCSSPTFAAMISLLNAQRLRNNQTSLGYLNPSLYTAGYSNGSSYFNDITYGANRCCANQYYPFLPTTCCESGFNATKGWDPVTGWGSVDFPNLGTLFSTVIVPESNNSSQSISEGLLIGIIFIGLVLFIFLITIVYYYFAKVRSNKSNNTSINTTTQNTELSPTGMTENPVYFGRVVNSNTIHSTEVIGVVASPVIEISSPFVSSANEITVK